MTQDEQLALDADQAARLIRKLPEFQERMAKYNAHVELARLCFTRSKALELPTVALLEQDICTAVDKDGAPVHSQRVMVALAQTLLR